MQATVAAGRRLRVVWSDPDQDRSRARYSTSRARVRAGAHAPIDWDHYVADLRRQVDDLHAKLSFAERQLPHPRARHMRLVGGEEREVALHAARDSFTAAVRRLDELTAPAAPPRPALDALGRERGVVQVGGRSVQLSRRHSEILALLAGRPDGMTTEELAIALYGDHGRPASVRTELCRLRKELAPWVRNEGNIVTADIDADFRDVQRLLRAGRAREAADTYAAPLLPRSEAPGIVQDRAELDGWVRSAVLTADDREALWAWLESASGSDDVPAWKRFLADLDYDDPRRPLAVTRLARLRQTLTLVRGSGSDVDAARAAQDVREA